MPQCIAKIPKGSVEYRLEGEGPTVVVLNGGHCSRRMNKVFSVSRF